MTSAAAYRVGLLGYGLAGEVFHAPLIAATPGLELAVVVTGDAARAARAQVALPTATITAESAAVWDCDVVVVATPNRFHAAYAREAIDRSVAVVVDKPLASSLTEVGALLDHTSARDGRLTVFQNRRWDGDFLTARQLIADGTMGEITRLQSRFERFRPEIKASWREGGDPADGGGQLLDLGAHLIDQALELLGPVHTVYAELDRRRAGAATDDDAFLALTHASGARSHLSMGAVSPVPSDRLALSGTVAGFSVRDLDVQEAQLRAGLPPTAAAFGLNPPGQLHDATGNRPHPLERGSYPAFYDGVRSWLDGGPPPVDPQSSRSIFQVIDAAQRSATEGNTVPLRDAHSERG